MTTMNEQPAGSEAEEAREGRALTNAEREMQELLAAARKLGIEGEESGDGDVDADAAQAVVELGLDQPVVEEETPVATFLTEDVEAEQEKAAAEERARAAAPPVESIQQQDAAWFAINTYTGHENRVKKALDLRIQNMDAAHGFVELPRQPDEGPERHYVLVPTQQEVEIRGGKRREVERKLLPGYVLVQIRLDPETGKLGNQSWHVVSGTAGVTGFVGGEDQARPLPAEEVAAIIGQTRVEEPRIRVGFAVNDSVRVTDGPFLDFIAQVDEINIEKGKVRVLISMFGRETPVELDFDQVEKQ